MKKILMVVFSLGALYSEKIVSTQQELKKEQKSITENNELEKLKSLELDQTKKSILLFENNPLVQSLLMDFLKNIMTSSEGKFKDILNKHTQSLSSKIKVRIAEEVEILRIENNKIKKSVEQHQKETSKKLKLLVLNEIKKIKDMKKIIEKNQEKNEKQMAVLKNVFKEVQDKMDSYTKYIDTKFSLKSVKDIELSRVFLIKDIFPIKYIKNFNSKVDITVVLNSDKEYGINSMITDRCRVEGLTNTHITIECIDANNKMYSNVMNLKITEEEDDYILNATKKKTKANNQNYSENKNSPSIKSRENKRFGVNRERRIRYN